ncbi:MAG: sulfite exporter TauE/SafE family protein [Phycisphaerales bacterium]|jgi:uncharacterized membrane protein YfcA|nr:sulfite exporter TauE/SafE family protein [Phycisphaerales bacterium]
MTTDSIAILAPLFFVVGALYASVGHAGASGYLAVMALLSLAPELMRSTALAINVLVAAIAVAQFARTGHFSWSLTWPFAVSSIPAAFVGGLIELPPRPLKIAIGVVLLLTALRMGVSAARRPGATTHSHAARPPSRTVALAVGSVLGLISGLTGTGGGIFLSPLLLLAHWADTKRTAATSACFILVNSVAGLGGQIGAGWTPQPWLAILASSACAGGLVGARFGSRRATPRELNALLAGVLLVAGGKLLAT